MNEQLTLLDVPTQPQPKRKSVRPAAPKHAETPAEKALRFRREAAEIRAKLRQAAQEGRRDALVALGTQNAKNQPTAPFEGVLRGLGES